MLKVAAFILSAMASSPSYETSYETREYAEVHEYITNEHCKEHYISKHRPACVTDDGECHPPGTDNGCRDVETWKWTNLNDPLNSYAPGVLPPSHRRVTHLGDARKKLVWAYTGDIRQALAFEVYGPDKQVTVETLTKTPVNQVSFLANIQLTDPAKWFTPGKNDTNGCNQVQTWQLPFGFDGKNLKTATEKFVANLTRIHESGVTITMTMGSWCTSFPLREWTEEEFQGFTTYFQEIRQKDFGGNLDGIDWDWEGYCSEICLKGNCKCGWDDKVCGTKSPDELKAGVKFKTHDDSPGHPTYEYECYILPTKETVQVMTGVTHHMKAAGFVVTLAPMSTAVYTSEEDKTEKQYMRNEFVKWRKHWIQGQQRDLLEMADSMLLQWYSGFDAALCMNSDDPKACTCDNVEVEDYPNIYNNTKDPHHPGLFYNYFMEDGFGGNMYPQTWPTRCQACGNNTIMPNGTRMDFPCYRPGDDWFMPGNVTKYPELIKQHNDALRNYTETYTVDGQPGFGYWWPKNMTTNSKCPRSLDCPDWRYHGEKPYSRQIKLLKSLSKVFDLDKLSIGFETLGVDVVIQQMSYADKALPWTTATNKEKWDKAIFFHECKHNITLENPMGANRCGAPLIQQQWGLKMNASEIVGLEQNLMEETGSGLAGIGVFTLDGMMWQPEGHKERFWYKELCKLNKHFQIPCSGPCCTQEHFDSPDEQEKPNPIHYSIHPDVPGGINDRSGETVEDEVTFLTDIIQ